MPPRRYVRMRSSSSPPTFAAASGVPPAGRERPARSVLVEAPPARYHRRASARVGPRATVIREPRQARKGATVSGLPSCAASHLALVLAFFFVCMTSSRSQRVAVACALIVTIGYHLFVAAPRARRLQRVLDTHDGMLGGGAGARDRPAGRPRARQRRRAARRARGEAARASTTLERVARVEVPRIGFVRYNAFSDVGSDLSYALALLNRDGDGVVLSSIYSREDTRTYGKAVVGVQARAGPVRRRARRHRARQGGRDVNDAKKTFMVKIIPPTGYSVYRLAFTRRHLALAGGGAADRAARGGRAAQLAAARRGVQRARAAGAHRRAAVEAAVDRQAGRHAVEPAQDRAARERRDQAADRRRPRQQAARVRARRPRRARARRTSPHVQARLRALARASARTRRRRARTCAASRCAC